MGELFKDHIALVTGSGHGIGRAIAIALASQGVKVVTNSRKQQKPAEVINYYGNAEMTAQAINDIGGQAVPCYADISNFEDAKRLVETTVSVFGRIDIVVNAAESVAESSAGKLSDEEWDLSLDTKPKGYFNVIHFAVPYMAKRGYGRIANRSSAAFTGDSYYDNPHYCASDAGVVGLTRAVAVELSSHGITCNAFCPLLSAETDPLTLTPFIVFLCSEQSANVSGTVFSIEKNTIARRREPIVCRTMVKPMENGIWTVEEIDSVVDDNLLSGYYSIAGKKKRL